MTVPIHREKYTEEAYNIGVNIFAQKPDMDIHSCTSTYAVSESQSGHTYTKAKQVV